QSGFDLFHGGGIAEFGGEFGNARCIDTLRLANLESCFFFRVGHPFTLPFVGGGTEPRRFPTREGRPRQSTEPTGNSAAGCARRHESRRDSGVNFFCRYSAAPNLQPCAQNSFHRGLR